MEMTLNDLLKFTVKRLWILLLALVVGAGGLLGWHSLTWKPMYEATATVYVLRDGADTDDAEDLSASLKMVPDCAAMLKSRRVLSTVIEQLGLELSWEQLRSRVSIHNPEETRLLEVSVLDECPVRAADIANALCCYGAEIAQEVLGRSQIRIFDEASAGQDPTNRPSPAAFVLAGVVAAGAVWCACLMWELIKKDKAWA